jgi:predicted transcriptional regulator
MNDFWNREKEKEEIITCVTQGKSVLIKGSYKIGKSCLLSCLEKELTRPYLCKVYYNLSNKKDEYSVWMEIGDNLINGLPIEGYIKLRIKNRLINIKKDDKDDLDNIIKTLKEELNPILGDRNIILVLLIDLLTPQTTLNSFTKHLKSLIQPPSYFQAVISTHEGNSLIYSELFCPLPIEYLSSKNAKQIIEEMLQKRRNVIVYSITKRGILKEMEKEKAEVNNSDDIIVSLPSSVFNSSSEAWKDLNKNLSARVNERFINKDKNLIEFKEDTFEFFKEMVKQLKNKNTKVVILLDIPDFVDGDIESNFLRKLGQLIRGSPRLENLVLIIAISTFNQNTNFIQHYGSSCDKPSEVHPLKVFDNKTAWKIVKRKIVHPFWDNESIWNRFKKNRIARTILYYTGGHPHLLKLVYNLFCNNQKISLKELKAQLERQIKPFYDRVINDLQEKDNSTIPILRNIAREKVNKSSTTIQRLIENCLVIEKGDKYLLCSSYLYFYYGGKPWYRRILLKVGKLPEIILRLFNLFKKISD